MRIVDADALTQKIDEILCEPDYQHTGENWSVGLLIAQNTIDCAPTIKAKPVVTSKWYTSLDKQKTICTNCHAYFDETNAVYWRYCPECGAEMEW